MTFFPSRLPDAIVNFELLPTEQGGRKSPTSSGYRPLYQVIPEYYNSVLHRFTGKEKISPGESMQAEVWFLTQEVLLSKDQKIKVFEGPKLVGYATILTVVNPKMENTQRKTPKQMLKTINRSTRVNKYDPFDSHVESVICLKCGRVMIDQEPMGPVPEFYHGRDPKRYCPNETKNIHPGVPGIAPFRRKRDRQARHAGAKKAGKLFKASRNK